MHGLLKPKQNRDIEPEGTAGFLTIFRASRSLRALHRMTGSRALDAERCAFEIGDYGDAGTDTQACRRRGRPPTTADSSSSPGLLLETDPIEPLALLLLEYPIPAWRAGHRNWE